MNKLECLLVEVIVVQPLFFFFTTDYMIPQTSTVTSSIGCFYFSSVLQFLVVVSVRYSCRLSNAR